MWIDFEAEAPNQKEVQEVITYFKRRAKPRFYADENFPEQAISLLRKMGAKVQTARRAGLNRRSDEECARRSHQLPRRRMAAQLFRADEATLRARAMKIVPVRAWKDIRTRTSKLEVCSSSTRRRPILIEIASEGQLQVRTPPANRTAQMRTATSMEPTIPSHSL